MCDFITFLRCSHPCRQILYVSQPNTSLYSNRFLQKLPQIIPAHTDMRVRLSVHVGLDPTELYCLVQFVLHQIFYNKELK